MPSWLLWGLLNTFLVVFDENLVVFSEQVVKEESKFLNGKRKVLRCDIDDIFAVGDDEELEFAGKAYIVVNVALLYHFSQIIQFILFDFARYRQLFAADFLREIPQVVYLLTLFVMHLFRTLIEYRILLAYKRITIPLTHPPFAHRITQGRWAINLGLFYAKNNNIVAHY